jgi:hypothetical protein
MTVSKVQKRPKLNKVATPQTSPVIPGPVAQVSAAQDQIRERAFAIYEKRGSRPGDEMQDWLRAERQIQAR